MQILEEVCLEKAFYRWCNTKISSSTIIALEKKVLDVKEKVEKEKEK